MNRNHIIILYPSFTCSYLSACNIEKLGIHGIGLGIAKATSLYLQFAYSNIQINNKSLYTTVLMVAKHYLIN